MERTEGRSCHVARLNQLPQLQAGFAASPEQPHLDQPVHHAQVTRAAGQHERRGALLGRREREACACKEWERARHSTPGTLAQLRQMRRPQALAAASPDCHHLTGWQATHQRRALPAPQIKSGRVTRWLHGVACKQQAAGTPTTPWSRAVGGGMASRRAAPAAPRAPASSRGRGGPAAAACPQQGEQQWGVPLRLHHIQLHSRLSQRHRSVKAASSDRQDQRRGVLRLHAGGGRGAASQQRARSPWVVVAGRVVQGGCAREVGCLRVGACAQQEADQRAAVLARAGCGGAGARARWHLVSGGRQV